MRDDDPREEPPEDERANIALRARLIREANERALTKSKAPACHMCGGPVKEKRVTYGVQTKCDECQKKLYRKGRHPWRRNMACGD